MLVAVKIREQVALAPLTTFQVGGPARYFVEARSATEVRDAVRWAAEHRLPLFVLGGGSNLVVADAGFPGLVLRVGLTGIEERTENGKRIFEAAAGEEWDALVERAVAKGCAGIECMSGIPGTVGGTPVQNVGAYGQEVAETITEVQALDLQSGEVRELCAESCSFAYRTSIFNSSERGRFIVLRVTFALTPGGAPRLEYADLKKFFAGRSGAPTRAETREAVRQSRLSKAMLIGPGDEDCRSAGSFFKNPLLTAEEFERVRDRAEKMGKSIPSYPSLDHRKVPAAWLVEQSGFPKGYRRGPVGISRRHALAIVNRGGARAADILALKDEIQKRVAEEFGVKLQPEPVFVGFDQPS